MNCPSCNGPMWDNREMNKKRVAEGKKPMPDYACRDKNGCAKVIWPPKEAKKAPLKATGGAAPYTKADKWASWEALSVAYGKAVDIGYKHMARVAKASGTPLSLDAVQAASATVFITASRDGVQSAPTGYPEGLDEDGGEDGHPY